LRALLVNSIGEEVKKHHIGYKRLSLNDKQSKTRFLHKDETCFRKVIIDLK